MKPEEFKEFLSKIETYQTIVIVGHYRTDCDSYASMEFFKDVLEKNNHKAIEVIDDIVADDLDSLLDIYEIRPQRRSQTVDETKCDLLLLVDCQYIRGEKNNNVAIPNWIDISSIPIACIDHHSDKGHRDEYVFCHIEEESKAMPTVFYRLYDSLPSEQQCTIALQGVLKDTHNLSEGLLEDKKCVQYFAEKCDFALILSHIVPPLDRDSLKAFGIGLQKQEHVGDICEFAFLEKITPDEFLGVPRVADELVNMKGSCSLAISSALVCDSEDKNKILISIRDKRTPLSSRDARKIATTLFADGPSSGGDKYKAAAEINLPLFREVCRKKFFSDLIESELKSRILASYLNKDDTDIKAIACLETSKDNLFEQLKNTELSETSIKQISRGLKGKHSVAGFNISYIHGEENDYFGSALSHTDISSVSCVRDILIKEKDCCGSIVYALVKNNSMSVIFSVQTEEENASQVLDSLVSKTEPHVILEESKKIATIKISLPIFKLTYRNIDLSRAVFEEFESRFSILGDNQYFLNYLDTKR